ncbi:phage tail assembly chaperone [Pseudomonas sp. NPDC087612]|uniref:phage tail assembly chaperone n=1 Tax=unclassified Pseudomonas TaxID=196821 RepID=UPI0005EBC573|nr:phage tail assembly chaperone [Pseudomonas sp. 2(2015)]KJK20352.1 phage tail protein [Pseudomonas sp. 2(2015)]
MSEYVFSASELAFYPAQLRNSYEASNTWPADSVSITAEHHARILEEQSQGRVIYADQDGRPMTKERPPLPPEVIAGIEKKWRDAQLRETDDVVARHRDELESGKTTLSSEQYQELQLYRAELREWPQAELFPELRQRPTAPTWLITQTQ